MKNFISFVYSLLFIAACLNAQNNQSPQFNGGDEELFNFIRTVIEYPPNAKRNDIQGTVNVSFYVDTLGNTDSLEIMNSFNDLLDKEALRVISLTDGKWTPGHKNGKLSSSKVNVPITFELVDMGNGIFLGSIMIRRNKEIAPQFIGGDLKLFQFLRSVLHYPVEARNKCIMGTVYTKFTVDTNGSVIDPEVVFKVDPLLDEEALRVVGLMNGKWLPGSRNDSLLNVDATLPIRFSLQNAGCKDERDHFRTGVEHYKNGETEKAITSFKRSVAMNPHYYDGLYNLAIVFIEKRDYHSACHYLKRIQQLGRENVDALILKYCRE